MQQPYMMFHPEQLPHVTYLWNGDRPVLIYHGKEKADEYLWEKFMQAELTDAHKDALDMIAMKPKQRIFAVPGHKRRFTVIIRGYFKPQEQ